MKREIVSLMLFIILNNLLILQKSMQIDLRFIFTWRVWISEFTTL